MWKSKPAKILFQLSGSISCFKAAQVISQLVQEGHQVQVVASKSALNFVGSATLEGLTGRAVAHEIFAEGEMMSHIQWTRWADLAVLCPASADRINNLAQGTGSDLIGSLSLAWPRSKPYLIFPAMNSQMWEHPTTQMSLDRLTQFGYHVYGTGQGTLACGEVGWGRLLEAEQILQEIRIFLTENRLTEKPKPSPKVLITAGGTREPLDGVRFLTNFSTGRTGSHIAQGFLAAGYSVTYLHGQGALTPHANPLARSLELAEFSSHQSLLEQLKNILSKSDYRCVIQAAAVSDFTIEKISTGAEDYAPSPHLKLRSSEPLTLQLRSTPKILPQIKSFSTQSNLLVIGFKLTQRASEEERHQKVLELFKAGGVDAVVSNDLSKISPEGHQHSSAFYVRGDRVQEWRNKEEMSQGLVQFVEGQR